MTFPAREYGTAKEAEDAVNKSHHPSPALVEVWLRAEIAFANANSKLYLVTDEVCVDDSAYSKSLARDTARQLAYARSVSIKKVAA
jgi:hypothetical protein